MKHIYTTLLLLLVSVAFAQDAPEGMRGIKVLPAISEVARSQFSEFCGPRFLTTDGVSVATYFKMDERHSFTKIFKDRTLDIQSIVGVPDYEKAVSLVIPEIGLSQLPQLDGFYQAQSVVLTGKKIKVMLDNFEKSGAKRLKLDVCSKDGVKLNGGSLDLDTQGSAELYVYPGYKYIIKHKVSSYFSEKEAYGIYKVIDGSSVDDGEQVHCRFVQPPSLRLKFKIKDVENLASNAVHVEISQLNQVYTILQPLDYAAVIPDTWGALTTASIKKVELTPADRKNFYITGYEVEKSGDDVVLAVSIKKKIEYDLQIQFPGLGKEQPQLFDWGVGNSYFTPHKKYKSIGTWVAPVAYYKVACWEPFYCLQRVDINVQRSGTLSIELQKSDQVTLAFKQGAKDMSTSYTAELIGVDKWRTGVHLRNASLTIPIKDGRRFVILCYPRSPGLPSYLVDREQLPDSAVLQVPTSKKVTVKLDLQPDYLQGYAFCQIILKEASGIKITERTPVSGKALNIYIPNDGYNYKLYLKSNNRYYPLAIPDTANATISQSISKEDFESKSITSDTLKQMNSGL